MKTKYIAITIIPTLILGIGSYVVASVPTSKEQVTTQAKRIDAREPKRSMDSVINTAAQNNKIDGVAKNKIESKQRELKDKEAAFIASLNGKTREEKLRLIKQEQARVSEWEKQNNVPSGYLFVMNPYN